MEPVDCDVGDWSSWAACDEACGGGLQKRSRTLTAPMHGGKACPAEPGKNDYQACNTQPCPVDCVVGDWSKFTDCTETCGGGTMTRHRDLHLPLHGGETCPNATEIHDCNTMCCAEDCEVSDWSAWAVGRVQRDLRGRGAHPLPRRAQVGLLRRDHVPGRR